MSVAGEQLRAGRAVVEALRAEGVTCVFGLPGGHVIEIYDGLYDAPDIRHVLVRHEAHAASMAAAYAQLTGEPGVCLVTAGPGATNLLTNIAEAYVSALPVVILAGRAVTRNTHRGASQELPTDRIFGPVTKWSARIDRADLVLEAVHQAFMVARNGRPGPVLLDLPKDVLAPEISASGYLPSRRFAPIAPRAEIERAVDVLLGAKRPILVAGGGVRAADGASELCELAELTATPVLTSLSGRGCIPDDHPLSAGGLGAHRNALSKQLLLEADAVLNFACRFEEMETNWRPGFVPAPDAIHVQANIDAAEIGHSLPAHVGVVGDVRETLRAMVEMVKERRGGMSREDLLSHPRAIQVRDGVAAVEQEALEMAESTSRPISPVRVVRIAREVFPRDAIVGIDIGVLAQHIAGAFPYFKVYEPRSVISPSSFYGMGFVAAALPVARVVHPDRHAIGFVGDGSFQMVMNILPTAAEGCLPVTWCILDDSALGSIWDIQVHSYANRILGTDFTMSPNFALLAEACGCYGERIEDPAEVRSAYERALKANEAGIPAVLDFSVARARLPQTTEHFGFYNNA